MEEEGSVKRLVALVAGAAVVLALGASAAWADQPAASGGGQSHLGAAFGFNAKNDLSGSFEYVGTTQADITVNGMDVPAGSGFNGHCFGYYRVHFVPPSQVRLFASCRGKFFVDGGPPIEGTVFVQAHVIDNGEPGTNDRACLDWGLNAGPGKGEPGVFVVYCGKVQSGNIQVNE